MADRHAVGFTKLRVLAATATVLGVLAILPAQANAIDYCGVLVLPKYDCYQMAAGSRAAGRFLYNVAHYHGSGTVSVCERTYIYGGGTVSRRCANNAVSSSCDLNYWYDVGYTLDGRVGNNSSYTHTIWGHATLTRVSCA